jgi:uracil-DNA glycosylase
VTRRRDNARLRRRDGPKGVRFHSPAIGGKRGAMGHVDDLRAELASVAASLRAYLELQQGSGASGVPRAKRVKAAQSTPSSPIDPKEPPASPKVDPAPPVSLLPPPPPDGAPAQDRSAAPAPGPAPRPLADLQTEVGTCAKCVLAKTRKSTVFARGNPEAQLCFVGEAPGADEDAQGLPFVGRAGQLLDKMIVAMGLSPERDVYICNIIKCRPPDNRRPEPDEIATCIPYLHEQLAIMRPKVIVALGNTAVGALLGTKLGITKVRGQWKLYKGATLVMPTYHPSYLIRPSAQQNEAKRQTWDDLQAVMKELKLPMPKRG